MGTLVTVVVLLAANGFFVAAEFALVKARGLRLEQLAGGGDPNWERVTRIHAKMDPYLAACQLGITMATLALGWVAGPAIAALLQPGLGAIAIGGDGHAIGALLGLLFLASLHTIVGEHVPKAVALEKPLTVARGAAYPLHVICLLLSPLTRLLSWAAQLLVRRLPLHGADAPELGFFGDSGKRVRQPEREAAQATSLTECRLQLDDCPVGSIMVPREQIECLDVRWEPEDVERQARASRHSRLPLLDGTSAEVQGFIVLRDLFAAALENGSAAFTQLSRYARDAPTVFAGDSVAQLFDLVRVARADLVLVADEQGAFVGMVCLEDMLDSLAVDNSDDTALICMRPAGVGWDAHGLVPLRDLERTIGLPVQADTGADTLCGLIMRHLDHVPIAGDEVRLGAFVIRVEAVRRHRVERASIFFDADGTL